MRPDDSRVVPFPGPGRARATGRRFAVVMVALVTVLGTASWVWRIGEVRVAGADIVGADRVLMHAGLRGDERIVWLRTGVIERRIEQIPGVRDASVRRRLPAALVIAVTERQPVASLGRGGLVVDAEGAVFRSPAADGLPVLAGLPRRVRAGRRIEPGASRFLGAYAEFPSLLRGRVDRIEVGDDLGLILAGGTRVRFGSAEQLHAKAAAAAAVLESIGERAAELEYVDVRVPTAPVSRERRPADSAEGTAGPPESNADPGASAG